VLRWNNWYLCERWYCSSSTETSRTFHHHTHAGTRNSAINFDTQCRWHKIRCSACDTRYQCIMPKNAKHTQIRPAINAVMVIHGEKLLSFHLEPRHITSFTGSLVHYVLEMTSFDTQTCFTPGKQIFLSTLLKVLSRNCRYNATISTAAA
jgi:hypothetical protein